MAVAEDLRLASPTTTLALVDDEAVTLRSRLEAIGISVLHPDYVLDQKEQLLRGTWPKVIGNAWRIPAVLAGVLCSAAFFGPLVGIAAAFSYAFGESIWGCIGYGVVGLMIGLVVGIFVLIAVLPLNGWLEGIASRASTRWTRTWASTYKLPSGASVVADRVRSQLPDVQLEVDHPSISRLPDPFLVASIYHHGTKEECHIYQWWDE